MNLNVQSKSLNICNEYFIVCFVKNESFGCEKENERNFRFLPLCSYSRTLWYILKRAFFAYSFCWILFQFQFNFCCERTRWEYLRRAAFILRGFYFFNFYIFGCIWFRIFRFFFHKKNFFSFIITILMFWTLLMIFKRKKDKVSKEEDK